MKILALFLFAMGCSDYQLTPIKPDALAPEEIHEAYETESGSQIDYYAQAVDGKVDVLFVIDNSGSMNDEQEELSLNFPFFLDYLMNLGVDYHIGVVSTDMYNADESGRLKEVNGYTYIDTYTPSAESVFSQMVEMGTHGSATERGRDAAYTALEVEKYGFNIGFRRDDVPLHVFVVSDEDDSSANSPYEDGFLLYKYEFMEYLNDLKTSYVDVTFSSIVNIPDGTCSSYAYGYDYLDTTDSVGGVKWEICEPDWEPVLDDLGLQASGLQQKEFLLSQTPSDSSAIKVTVVESNGATTVTTESDGQWYYDSSLNSIVFNEGYYPPPYSEIYIEYETPS